MDDTMYLESLSDGRRFALVSGQLLVVGRGNECDLALDDDSTVSRFHCCVLPLESGDGLLVRDLGSRNGTYISGRRLRRESILRSHQVLRIGHGEYRLRTGAAETEPQESFAATNSATSQATAVAPRIPTRPAWLRAPSRPWWLRGTQPSSAEEPAAEESLPQPVQPAAEPRLTPASEEIAPVSTPSQQPSPIDRPVQEFQPSPSLPAKPHPPPAQTPIKSVGELNLAPVSEEIENAPIYVPAVEHERTLAASAAPPLPAPKPKPPAPPIAKEPTPKLDIDDPSLSQLVAMERQAKAIRRRPEAAPPPTAKEKQEIPIGYWQPARAGQGWNGMRDALHWLSLVSLAATVLINLVTGTILLRSLALLARNGLSVFIPFQQGGPQFTDTELVEIGVAMALVVGTPIVLFQAASRYAEEVTALVLWGLAASILPASIFGANPVLSNVLLKSAAVLFAVWALAAAGLVVRCLVAPVKAADQLCLGTATVFFGTCALCLVMCLGLDAAQLSALALPLSTPPIHGWIVAAVTTALVAILLVTLVLRTVALKYGDEPTQASVNGYLIYHAAAALLSLLFVAMINSGSDGGWGSALLGLLTLSLLNVDFVVFVQMLRNACYTLR